MLETLRLLCTIITKTEKISSQVHDDNFFFTE